MKLTYFNSNHSVILNVTYLFFFLSWATIGCRDNGSVPAQDQIIDQNSEQQEPDKETIVVQKTNLLAVRSVFNVQTRTGKSKSIFLSYPKKINWKEIAPLYLKPKSEENLIGKEIETMAFGDFGYIDFHFLSPYSYSESVNSYLWLLTPAELIPIYIDSLVGEVTYYHRSLTNGPSYDGKLIGRSISNIPNASFAILSDIETLNAEVKFFPGSPEYINVRWENYHGVRSPSLEYLWEGKTYKARIGLSVLKREESFGMMLSDTIVFIHSAYEWDGTGQLCNNYYNLHQISGDSLKLIASNHYECDH